MTPNIKKIKEFCDKNGIQFEIAPKSLTGLTTGYLIIDTANSSTNYDFLQMNDTPNEYYPNSKEYWEEVRRSLYYVSTGSEFPKTDKK